MKLTGRVKSVQDNTSLYSPDEIIVDCGKFSFKAPKHVAKSYYIGRDIEIEVNPK